MMTGKKIWFYNAELPIRIAPTVANNKVLVQTIDNTLIALNATTGVISGTPTDIGNFSFTVTATYDGSGSKSAAYTLAVA